MFKHTLSFGTGPTSFSTESHPSPWSPREGRVASETPRADRWRRVRRRPPALRQTPYRWLHGPPELRRQSATSPGRATVRRIERQRVRAARGRARSHVCWANPRSVCWPGNPSVQGRPIGEGRGAAMSVTAAHAAIRASRDAGNSSPLRPRPSGWPGLQSTVSPGSPRGPTRDLEQIVGPCLDDPRTLARRGMTAGQVSRRAAIHQPAWSSARSQRRSAGSWLFNISHDPPVTAILRPNNDPPDRGRPTSGGHKKQPTRGVPAGASNAAEIEGRAARRCSRPSS